MKKDLFIQYLYRSTLVAISILVLMSPALYNGFPLVYSDTGTYIAAAQTHSIPVDRPIGYSLFLNITSLNINLWFTILVQCVVIFYLVFQLFDNVFQIRHSYEWSAGSLVILSLTTSISNYTSQLMPDIFVSWMILSTFILLFQQETRLLRTIFLSLIFIVSVISHFSVLFGAVAIVLLFVLLNSFYKWTPKSRNYYLLCLLVIGWLTIPIINSAYGVGFKLSRCKNISIMGRLVETGVVGEFLHENCETNKYPLCAYKDSLPEYGYIFLWEEFSPLYKGPCLPTGWGNCWIEKNSEYGVLIHDIVTTPKYLKKLIRISIKSTYDQMRDFKIGMLVPMKEQSPPYGTIKTFYPQNLSSYTKARQFNGILYFNTISAIQRIFVIISLLSSPILLFLLKRRKNRINIYSMYVAVIIVGLISNAAVCSGFSTVVDRYQSRVIWLIPFLLITALSIVFSIRKQN